MKTRAHFCPSASLEDGSYCIDLNCDERCGFIVTQRCKMLKLLAFYYFKIFCLFFSMCVSPAIHNHSTRQSNQPHQPLWQCVANCSVHLIITVVHCIMSLPRLVMYYLKLFPASIQCVAFI